MFLSSYNTLKTFSLSVHARRSTSERVRLKRRSAALTRLRAARQSASNHGVGGLLLRRTCTTGQCWSSKSVNTWLYRSGQVHARTRNSVHSDQCKSLMPLGLQQTRHVTAVAMLCSPPVEKRRATFLPAKSTVSVHGQIRSRRYSDACAL